MTAPLTKTGIMDLREAFDCAYRLVKMRVWDYRQALWVGGKVRVARALVNLEAAVCLLADRLTDWTEAGLALEPDPWLMDEEDYRIRARQRETDRSAPRAWLGRHLGESGTSFDNIVRQLEEAGVIEPSTESICG